MVYREAWWFVSYKSIKKYWYTNCPFAKSRSNRTKLALFLNERFPWMYMTILRENSFGLCAARQLRGRSNRSQCLRRFLMCEWKDVIYYELLPFGQMLEFLSSFARVHRHWTVWSEERTINDQNWPSGQCQAQFSAVTRPKLLPLINFSRALHGELKTVRGSLKTRPLSDKLLRTCQVHLKIYRCIQALSYELIILDLSGNHLDNEKPVDR